MTLNIRVKIGATFELPFSVADSDGDAVSLVGFLGRGTIRATMGGTSLAAFDVYVTDAVAGHGVAMLSATTTAAITATTGYFDVELYNSDGVVYRPDGMQGVVFFDGNITT